MTKAWIRSALFAAAVAGSSSAGAADRAILFLFDTSGSLRDQDIERGRILAREVFAGLSADERAGVLSFDDKPQILTALAHDPEAFENALQSVKRHGRFTVLHDALYDAARLLRESQAARRAIVVLTDGHDENSALLFEDAERELSQAEVAVFAVGVGPRVDQKLLRRIAKLRDGEFYEVEQLADAGALARLVLERIDALAPGTTPVPPATPTPTATPVLRRPRVATLPQSGSGGAGGVPEPAAPSSAVLSLEVAALFLGIALVIILLQRFVARRRSAPKTVPYSPPAPTIPAPQDVAALGGTPGFSIPGFPPPEFISADPAGGDDATELVATMPDPPAVLETIPFGSAPPIKLAKRLHEFDDSDEVPLDPLSSTLVGGRVQAYDGEAGFPGDGDVPLDRTCLLELKPKLVVRKGRNTGETFLVRDDGDTFIGRGKVNHLVLGDKAVSTRHARIAVEGRVFILHDLQSTNGTFLNGQRLGAGQTAQLQEGDLLRVGETELEFKVEQQSR